MQAECDVPCPDMGIETIIVHNVRNDIKLRSYGNTAVPENRIKVRSIHERRTYQEIHTA